MKSFIVVWVATGFAWSALDRRCWVCTTFDLACFNNTDDLYKWNWPNLR